VGISIQKFKFQILAALALYLLDAFCISQGFLACLVAIIVTIVGLFKIIKSLLKRQPMPYCKFVTIGLFALAAVCTIYTIHVNNLIAKQRGDILVTAIKQYKATHNQYPEKLQDLVPEFVPKVPKAKYVLGEFGNFRYFSYKKDPPILFYYYLPPFGRPTYNFQKEKWTYLD